MSQRRSGEHRGYTYRCWLEPGQGQYRGWYRGKALESAIGDLNFVDRLHGQTPFFDTAEEALNEAERRQKTVIDEATDAATAEGQA